MRLEIRVQEQQSFFSFPAGVAQELSQTLCHTSRLPYAVLENVVDLILRDQKDVRRVVYDLSPSSNYSGIEWQ